MSSAAQDFGKTDRMSDLVLYSAKILSKILQCDFKVFFIGQYDIG